jgi:hypothetical protein
MPIKKEAIISKIPILKEILSTDKDIISDDEEWLLGKEYVGLTTKVCILRRVQGLGLLNIALHILQVNKTIAGKIK